MTHKQCVNNALQRKVLSYKKTENNQHSKNTHIFRSMLGHAH